MTITGRLLLNCEDCIRGFVGSHCADLHCTCDRIVWIASCCIVESHRVDCIVAWDRIVRIAACGLDCGMHRAALWDRIVPIVSLRGITWRGLPRGVASCGLGLHCADRIVEPHCEIASWDRIVLHRGTALCNLHYVDSILRILSCSILRIPSCAFHPAPLCGLHRANCVVGSHRAEWDCIVCSGTHCRIAF